MLFKIESMNNTLEHTLDKNNTNKSYYKLLSICFFYSLPLFIYENYTPLKPLKLLKQNAETTMWNKEYIKDSHLVFTTIIILLFINKKKVVEIKKIIWWKELIIIGIVSISYSLIKKCSATKDKDKNSNHLKSFNNALFIIRKEKSLGIFNEASIQKIFMPYTWFIKLMNIYYGTAHFILTLSIFILLYIKKPNDFRLWRSTFIIMNGIALVVYALFPMMPPRLLDTPCPKDGGFGGACIDTTMRTDTFGFIDTISVYGGPWNFSKGVVKNVSNQYGAMPSLHVGWSMWCVFALYPFISNNWIRGILFIYPLITTLSIVVTANHFWLDAVYGIIVFIVAFIFAYLFFN